MTETVVTIERGPKSTSAAPPPQQAEFRVQFNVPYFLTLPGILKIAQLILGILCMALASPGTVAGTKFFLFVVVVAFILTLMWSFAYLFGIREAISFPINWILTELINTGVVTVLYVIGSIVQLCSGLSYAGYIAAGIFGVLNTIAYGAGCYFLYLVHKSGSTQ